MNTKYKNEPLTDAKLFSFMLENEQRDWLNTEAKRRGVSVSRLMRDAIEVYRATVQAMPIARG